MSAVAASKAFVRKPSGARATALGDFRKDIVIELLNEAGQLALAFIVYRCWPSEYVAFASLASIAPAGRSVKGRPGLTGPRWPGRFHASSLRLGRNAGQAMQFRRSLPCPHP